MRRQKQRNYGYYSVSDEATGNGKYIHKEDNMALFVRDQVVQIYSVREATGKDGKERSYANIGFLSSSRVQGTDDYSNDEALYVSGLVKGKAALEFLKAVEPKSLALVTLKVYSYSTEKEGKKIQNTAWDILKAEPFVSKGKEEPKFQEDPDLPQ
jgi:hypothetical protein